jgi:preprotein translocase subunit SecA
MIGMVNRLLALFCVTRRDRARRRLDELISVYALKCNQDLVDDLVALREKQSASDRAFGRRHERDVLLNALAIAVCLFARRPCDLAPGTTLYPEQVDAAYHLVRHANVQMDTGEGKTYVLAVAAVALTIFHPSVLVVTANQYLAGRDLRRVLPYFTLAGIALSRGLPAEAAFKGVCYVTLPNVCFGYLDRAYGNDEASYPNEAAVLVDELDSIAIDQARVFELYRPTVTTAADWGPVAAAVRSWGPDHHRLDDDGDIVLGPAAWHAIAGLARDIGRPVSMLLELASALVWAATAIEGRDYLWDGDEVLLINSDTGLPYRSSHSKSGALLYLGRGTLPTVSVTLARVDSLSLLKRHPHVVGVSGTLREETFYLLQQFRTLTVSVPARFQRHHGPIVSRLFRSRPSLLQHIVARVRDVSGQRPVIVGTRSTEEADAVARILRVELKDLHVPVQLLTSYSSASVETFVARAGKPGVVTVINQAGSRGLDIRSQHRPLMLVIDMGEEPRLDRQFLGRVGRHGEPFDVEFLLDPTCDLLAGVRWLGRVFDGDELLGTYRRALRRCQRRVWAGRVARRQLRSKLDAVEDSIERATAELFADARAIRDDDELREISRKYVDQLVGTLPNHERGVHELLTRVTKPDAIAGGATGAPPREIGDRLFEAVQHGLDRRRSADMAWAQLKGLLEQASASTFACSGSHGLTTYTDGPRNEISTTLAWAQAQEKIDGPVFSAQAHALLTYGLATPSTPESRLPVEILRESLCAWHTRFLAEAEREKRLVGIAAAPSDYSRRAAYAVREAWKRAEDDRPEFVINNVLLADQPANLDALFHVADNKARVARRDDPELGLVLFSPATPERVQKQRGLDDKEKWPSWICGYLEASAPTAPWSGRHQDAETILTGFCQTVFCRLQVSSPERLGREIEHFLESLALHGDRPRFRRRARLLVVGFVNYLHDEGVIHQAIPRTNRPFSALRFALRYMRTLSAAGIAILAFEMVVLALATLVHGTVHPPGSVLRFVADVFGLAHVLPNRPLLFAASVAVTAFGVLRVVFDVDDVVQAGPLLLGLTAVVTTIAAINGGVALAIGTGLLVILWLFTVLSMDRLAGTLIVSNGLLLVAALVAGAFLVSEVRAGRFAAAVVVGVGMLLAAQPGPRLRVAIGSVDYSDKGPEVRELSAERRLAVDPGPRSAPIAFALTVPFLGIHGVPALVGMALVQCALVGHVTRTRLQLHVVERSLAELGAGTPLGEKQLHMWIRRHRITFPLGRWLLIAAATTALLLQGHPSSVSLVILELAGVVAGDGLRVARKIVTPTLSVAPLTYSDPDGGTTVMERIRSIKKSSYRSLGIVVGTLFAYRVLEALSDMRGVLEMIQDVARFFGRLL